MPSLACAQLAVLVVISVVVLPRLDGAAFGAEPGELTLPQVIARVKPAVVTLKVFKGEQPYASGTGWFLERDLVVTNLHVVAGGDRVEAHLSDARLVAAEGLVADDADADLAILKLTAFASPPDPLPLRSETVVPGERVLVVGSPKGMDHTASDGIVSGLREMGAAGGLIQTTAPVSPGSSGSPLLAADGRVVGIVVMQLTEGQNLNFAVPVDRLARLQRTPVRPFKSVSVGKSMIKRVALEQVTKLGGVKYDRFKDEIRVVGFAPASIPGAVEDRIIVLAVGCSNKGQVAVPPSTLWLAVLEIQPADADRGYRAGDDMLVLMSEGTTRVRLEKFGELPLAMKDNRVRITAHAFLLSADEFRAVRRMKELEGQLGDTEFAVVQEGQDALQQFAIDCRLELPPPPPPFGETGPGQRLAKELEQARAERQAAERAMWQRIESDPQYQKLVILRDEADAARKNPPTPTARLDLSRRFMEAKEQVQRCEREWFNRSAEYQEAAMAVSRAEERLKAAEAEYDRSLKTPESRR